MLKAVANEKDVFAWSAQRGETFLCPECKKEVVLKRGHIKIPHFAHKPPTSCSWATGESRAHMLAKIHFYEKFLKKGVRAELEHVITGLHGDRRADVMAWAPNGQRYAIELQHTPICSDDLERRTLSYLSMGIRVIWIVVVSEAFLADAVGTGPADQFRIERHAARDFERWIHGFNYDHLWYYDPESESLWRGHLSSHIISRDGASWYEAGGRLVSVSGYRYYSKRWRELALSGPFPLEQAILSKFSRSSSKKFLTYNYPTGVFGALKVQSITQRASPKLNVT